MLRNKHAQYQQVSSIPSLVSLGTQSNKAQARTTKINSGVQNKQNLTFQFDNTYIKKRLRTQQISASPDHETDSLNKTRQGSYTANAARTTAVFAAVVVYVMAVVASAFSPPTDIRNKLGAVACLRATRKHAAVVAKIVLGNPRAEYTLLVRNDLVTTGMPTLRIWNSRIYQSSTLYCKESAMEGTIDITVCDDVGIVLTKQKDRRPLHQTSTVLFEALHVNDAMQSRNYDSYLYDGELVVGKDTYFSIGPSTVCMRTTVPTAIRQEVPLVAALLTTGVSTPTTTTTTTSTTTSMLMTSTLQMEAAGRPWSNLPAAVSCNNSNLEDIAVHLFPAEASDEAAWLGIRSDQIKMFYDVSGKILDALQTLSEVHSSCSAQIVSQLHNKSSVLFDALCKHSRLPGLCHQMPSVPYRRVSGYAIDTFAGSQHSLSNFSTLPNLSNASNLSDPNAQLDLAHVWLFKNDAVANAANASDNDHADSNALLRTLLVVLVSATMFLHSDDRNITGDEMYVQCINGTKSVVEYLIQNKKSVFTNLTCKCVELWRFNIYQYQDAVLGLLCAVSRITIGVLRWNQLSDNGWERAVVVNVTVGLLSLVHWTTRTGFMMVFVRYDKLVKSALGTDCSAKTNDRHAATGRDILGGTCAIADGTSAMLFAFASAPISSASSDFDPIARLLVGVLGVILVLPRCAWSSACCMSQTSIVLTRHTGASPIAKTVWIVLCTFAVCFWLAQSVSLAVAITDLVATPSAVEWSRNSSSDTGLVAATIAIAIGSMGVSRGAGQAHRILNYFEQDDRQRGQTVN